MRRKTKPKFRKKNEEVYSEEEYKEMRKRVREMEQDETGAYLIDPKGWAKD